MPHRGSQIGEIMRILTIILLLVLTGCDAKPRLSVEEAQAWIDSMRLPYPYDLHVPAPNFDLPIISADVAGEHFRLSDLSGRVVVLNLWSTWCKPCIAEHSTFERLARRFAADSVQFLGIVGEDTPDRVLKFEETNPTGYPNLHDKDGTVSSAYGSRGVPHHVVIDRNGMVVYSAPGGPIIEEPFATVIERVLADQVDSLVERFTAEMIAARRTGRS